VHQIVHKISDFSPHLFWDANKRQLSLKSDKIYIIKQVLDYGLKSDWDLIHEFYGIDTIAEVAVSLRDLDPKSVSFISMLSNIPKEEFRCYTWKQSVPQHWNF
jgi:hypothetical protein